MWLLVGLMILLSRAVIGNLNEENAYYLSEMDEDKTLLALEKPRETGDELEASEATKISVNEDDEQSDDELDYPRLKSDTKRSIVHVNLRDARSEHRQAPVASDTFLYSPNREEQIGMAEGPYPVINIQKRRNSLSSWGGKRDVEPRYKAITKIRRPVRVPFNSWGGKRNSETILYPRDDIKIFNLDGKKTPFNSWGGKRVPYGISPVYETSMKHRYEQEERRSSLEPQQRTKIDEFDMAHENHDEKLANNETEEKRGSLKLIGSGEITTSGSTMANNLPRVPFEPWGGKRGELRFANDDEHSARLSLIFRKIERSIPWTE